MPHHVYSVQPVHLASMLYKSVIRSLQRSCGACNGLVCAHARKNNALNYILCRCPMNVAAGMLNARLPVDPSLLCGRRVGRKVDPLLDGSCQLRLHQVKVLTLHSIHGRQRQELWSAGEEGEGVNARQGAVGGRPWAGGNPVGCASCLIGMMRSKLVCCGSADRNEPNHSCPRNQHPKHLRCRRGPAAAGRQSRAGR